ncbi:unnamed protein product [Ceratitis capitata]|uniref:(Mediterranean fruit fly) hypothetical protein n=1 Tax=Ceratitis capitata TaxID=7213 RepID=A0A811V4L7_CERCA|nr:unnamed protein product [Ceratitis capitata]CAD7006389.1 unnamed protein product [Ceratitis capitata]
MSTSIGMYVHMFAYSTHIYICICVCVMWYTVTRSCTFYTLASDRQCRQQRTHHRHQPTNQPTNQPSQKKQTAGDTKGNISTVTASHTHIHTHKHTPPPHIHHPPTCRLPLREENNIKASEASKPMQHGECEWSPVIGEDAFKQQ